MQTVLATLLAAVAAGTIACARPREIITPQWPARAALPVHRSAIELRGAPPIQLQIMSPAGTAAVARLDDTARRTLQVFTDWLGPPAASSLIIVDLPWGIDAPAASYPGIVATRTRMVAPARDLIAERAVVAGLARQFWPAPSEGTDASFLEGLVIYTATRGIHTVLEGRNFAAPRFFGGFVSFPLRPLLLSPSPQGPQATLRQFDEVVEPAEAPWRYAGAGEGSAAQRAATALRTLERTIGWPAMQQALIEARVRSSRAPLSPELLAAIVAEQRGHSMDWFARDLVRGGDAIDYAVDAVRSESSGGRVRTMIAVRRAGRGVFAATDQPRAAGAARSIDVLVRFADGSESRAFVDGRDETTELQFDSAAPVATVSIDSANLVAADVDRSNNGRVIGDAPANRTGIRMVLSWVIWLQNVMLTGTALA